jgi:hypothetical protein
MLIKISDVLKERPDFGAKLEPFHPVKSAALVAGLLVYPSLHANTLRLEMLVHVLIAYAGGSKKPKHRHIKSWLNTQLGSSKLVLLEDPIEDVFISNVTTEEGNVRIFEGLWESNDFYLQRIVNVVNTLPDDPAARHLKREIRAILRLSEEIAARRGLNRFSSGGGQDKGRVAIPSTQAMESLCQAVKFSPEDLQQLGILPTDLTSFIFQLDSRDQLRDQAVGDSDLERRPIVQDAGKWYVLLPSAISFAVRQYALQWFSSRGYQDSFDQHFVKEYFDFFRETPILGSYLPKEMPLPSNRVAGKTFLEFATQVDAGRCLQIVIIIDGVEGYLSNGFGSPDSDISELSDQINQRVKTARNYFRKQGEFKQGLSLLIGCGYGRPSFFHRPAETADWRIEFVSAPDFQALAWVPGASPLFLWKLVDHERFLAENGVSFLNANGLLNLYGWWAETNYFMLHPEIEFSGDPINILLPTDCLAGIRKKVRQGWDVHALPLPGGKFARVRREAADSYFADEAEKPRYACIDALLAQKLLGAWVGDRLIWWVATEHDESGLSRDIIFRIWDAINNWLSRAAPILERRIEHLADQAIVIVLNFNKAHQEQPDSITEDVTRSCISVTTNLGKKAIHISLCDPFFGSLRNPKNLAERALIRSVTIGVLELSDEIWDEKTVDTIVSEIIPNHDARYVHFFEAIHFRDYIQQYDRPKKLLIDDADAARSKLGLGWAVQNKADGVRFTTAEQSFPFLNRVVETIWERMHTRLHNLNRRDLIESALRHIEGVEAEKTRWNRTIRALLALRDQKTSAKTVAMQQIARCNAAEIALRLIIEMAVPECPLEGGEPVGALDLTPLMSDVLMIFHLGGCSDAIRKGVMEPEVRIAPSGDILTDAGFREEIADPFGQRFESVRLDHEVARYERHFQPLQPISTTKGLFPEAFIAAFEAEFGLSIDAVRGVREVLENLAYERRKCVCIARRDEILSYCKRSGFATAELVEVFLGRFALWPREAWDKTPEGFNKRDWYPWRFGRRLSLVARPLVRLENEDNPRYVISPGLLGMGFAYTVARYYEAEVEVSECKSTSMRHWINDETNRRGHAFARKVFETMCAQGYEARLEETITALLNEKLERDWGDVDVLAWKTSDKDVLAIECKDLKIAKTPNEIAEQLNRFSGQVMANGKSDDLLKHVERCNFLKERAQRVAQAIGMVGRGIEIRTVVCFSNPVPMQYVAKQFSDVKFLTIDDLSEKLV